MPAHPVGPFPLDGVDFETWLIKYDKAGACISPQTRDALLARLDSISAATPVVLFSHGWNNEFGDAKTLYATFLKHLQAHSRTYAGGTLRPLFVGVIWPSTWLSFDTGPAMAGPRGAARLDPAAAAFEGELADALTDPYERERFDTLIESSRLDADAGAELARLLAKALAVQSAADAEDAEQAAARDGDVMLAGMTAVQATGRGDQLPEGGTINRAPGVPQPRDAGLLNLLDPRNALRVASVYQMKDRAGTVGWNGLSSLIRDILANSPSALHVVGHSYGAKVILSALARADLPRPVASVLLLQPAVSHLCFAEQIPGRPGLGGYRQVLGKIRGSLIMTYSAHDRALHDLFHLALRRRADLGEVTIAGGDTTTAAGKPPSEHAALGGYGPRGCGQLLMEPLPLPGTPIALPADLVPLAFDGTLERRVAGHGDVATAATAWLLFSQMAH